MKVFTHRPVNCLRRFDLIGNSIQSCNSINVMLPRLLQEESIAVHISLPSTSPARALVGGCPGDISHSPVHYCHGHDC